MNINAINQMMINKNLKFRANEVPQEPQKPMGNSPEGTVTKPQDGMKALANNNIAFQGLNLSKVAEKMGPAARKTILPILGAAMLAPALTSCQKEPIYIERPPVIVDNDITVNVDMSQINALLEYFKERDAKLFDLLNGLVKDLEQGRIDDAAFQEQVINYMLESKENQNTIIDLLVQNGKSDAEAKAYLEKILEEVKNGNLSATDAYKQIMEELGEINNSLDYIKELIKQGFEDLMIQNELLASREEASDKAMQDLLKAILAGEVDIMALIKDANTKLDRSNDALDKVCLNQEKILEAIENGDVNSVGDLAALLGKSIDEVKALLKELVGNSDIIIDETTDAKELLQYIANNMVTKKDLNDLKAEFLDLLAKAKELYLTENQEFKDLISGLDFSCKCEHNCNCSEKLEEIIDKMNQLIESKNHEGILGNGILDDIVNNN